MENYLNYQLASEVFVAYFASTNQEDCKDCRNYSACLMCGLLSLLVDGC